MRIYLVGFMGSGKSTLGSAAAEKLHVPFIDTDNLIEASEQMTIADIFNEKGEQHFRELESQVLAGTLFFPKALIATGGGLPCFNNNMERMRREGITIYLEWSWDSILARLKQDTAHRPLLSAIYTDADWNNIEAIFNARKVFYEQASMTIEMTDDYEGNLAMLENACDYIWR